MRGFWQRSRERLGMSDDDIELLQQLIGHGGKQAFSLVPMALGKVISEKQWQAHRDKQGNQFPTFEAFVVHPLWWGLETTIAELEAFCRKRPDIRSLILQEMEPGRGHLQDEKGRFVHSDNVTMARGNSALYTIKRLKRDRPDLFQQVLGGNLSANAAAKEAGWRKPPMTHCPHCGKKLRG